MNCAEAKRILALTRDGELSPGEERALEAHLRTCPACSAERASFLEQSRALERLRSIVPALRDPEENIRAVLNRVRADRAPLRQGVLSAVVDRLIRALEVPGLRYALAVFVTVTVTGFVFQQVTILKSVSALETRLSRPEAPRIRTAYMVLPADLQRLSQSPGIRTIVEKAESRQGSRLAGFEADGTGPFLKVLDSPESRWMVRTFLPRLGEADIDTLVTVALRNVHQVLTFSKGEAGQ